jgi:hypothetical protein
MAVISVAGSGGPPEPVAPPCILHRAFPRTAGDWQRVPLRVLAPHRGARDSGAARPGCLGRRSFLALPAPFLPAPLRLVHNSNHPLATRMEVDVADLDSLAIAAAVAIKRPDEISLEPEQLDCVGAVNVDEIFGHVPMALSQEAHS